MTNTARASQARRAVLRETLALEAVREHRGPRVEETPGQLPLDWSGVDWRERDVVDVFGPWASSPVSACRSAAEGGSR